MKAKGWILAGLLLSACASSPAVTSLRLPDFLAEFRSAPNGLELRQTIAFAGSKLRICRTLSNPSRGEILVSYMAPSDDIADDLSSYYFDSDGDFIYPDLRGRHASFLMPRIPAGPDDMFPYRVIGPGESVEHCTEIAPPPDHDRFQVVSHYGPTLDPGTVSPQVAANRTVVGSPESLLSNVCAVSIGRRRIIC